MIQYLKLQKVISNDVCKTALLIRPPNQTLGISLRLTPSFIGIHRADGQILPVILSWHNPSNAREEHLQHPTSYKQPQTLHFRDIPPEATEMIKEQPHKYQIFMVPSVPKSHVRERAVAVSAVISSLSGF